MDIQPDVQPDINPNKTFHGVHNCVNRLSVTLMLALAWLTGACSLYPDEAYQELVVVESYLITGEPLAEVRVSKTLPVFEEYSFERAALTDAAVVITEMDPEGGAADAFLYEPVAEEPGVYRAVNRAYRVKPATRYDLSVSFGSRDEELRATTITPGQVTIVSEIPETLLYQSEEQLQILVQTGAPYSGVGADDGAGSGSDGSDGADGSDGGLDGADNIADGDTFIINTIAQDTTYENLTPFYLNLVDEVEDISFEELQVNSSGLLNEASFGRNEDGLVELQYPWLAVVFLGQNEIVVHSVDTNTNLFFRSQSVQLGGSTLPPGEIPNITYRVDGGIGVFGSSSTDTARVFIEFPAFDF